MAAPRTAPRFRRSSLLVIGLAAALGLGLLNAVGGSVATAAVPSGWLHTSGSRILDADDRDYQIKAVNWFGLETPQCSPHGLWQISLNTGMAQIAGFGFNTIRLPFSNACLIGSSATGIDAALNPSLVGKSGLEVLDAVIASAKAHGLKVILDRHRPEAGSQSELWHTPGVTERQWITDWTMLATRYGSEPTVVGADLHNEPHAGACWGCGDPARDWAAAATRAGNAVLAANPRLLILVEGVERPTSGATTWWGGGLADARTVPITLSEPGRLVYSPHDYPASIYPQTWFAATDYPANLPGVWDRNWGFLQKEGLAPVLLGEFGTKLETTSDRQWLTTLVDYLHTQRMSFAFWSFNPNSGDTGGLVQDDWTTPEAAKLALLAPLLRAGSPSAGTASPTTDTSPVAPTAAPAPTTIAPITTTTTTTTKTPSSTPTAPVSTGATATPDPPSVRGPVQPTWTLQSAWLAGYVADITVTADAFPVGSWTLSWPDPAATGVANAWGMTCTVERGEIRCIGADWARSLRPGQVVRVGLQVATTGGAPTRPTLTVG